jgi:two-component system NtrC family sensor kinase
VTGDLEQALGSAISEHLHGESELSLIHAYDLGRRAIADGFGILDVFSLFEASYRELVLSAPKERQASIAAGVARFFRELLSLYEMTFRGYHEANQELQRLNADLRAAYDELQARQMQLVQSAKMASLGELVAGVAHEINNPLAFVLSHLNTIKTNLEILEREPARDTLSPNQQRWRRVRDRLLETESGLERIRKLVLQLRTFSRLDEGERKPVSMRESIGSVLTILEHRYKGRIEVRAQFGEPDVVDCLPGLLNQAVMNLVSNAIDATPEEGIITIETGSDGDDFVISVRDTGHGIPEAIRDRVLEPFFTTKPPGSGTGLGLSITNSIAKQHGGALEIHSSPGSGTTIVFRFPQR